MEDVSLRSFCKVSGVVPFRTGDVVVGRLLESSSIVEEVSSRSFCKVSCVVPSTRKDVAVGRLVS